MSVNGHVTNHDLDYLEQIAAGLIPPEAVDTDALTSRAYGHAAVPPKYQRVDLFNYSVSVGDFDSHDFNADEYRNTKTGFNADVGLAASLNTNWNMGLAVQNLLPRSIDTRGVNGEKETFKVKPQATVGTSWHNSVFTAALDVDLTEASRFTRDEKRQFASLGGEVNAWDWMQVRAEYFDEEPLRGSHSGPYPE